MSKTCIKCNKEKDLKDFFQRHNQCKDCMKIYQRAYLQTEAGKIAMRRYNQSRKGKKNKKRYSNKYQNLNPRKVIAQNALNCAIKAGKINRESCGICGSIVNVHGHHSDYDQLLDVIWLCQQHHVYLHKTLKEA